TLEQLLQLSLKRYEVGQITQADILQIENERLALENKAFELEKDRRVTESMLNGVLGNNEIRWPDSIPVDWTNNFSVVLDTLIQNTLPKKPEIQGMNHEIAMFTAEKKAAHREWFPDIMVRGMYKDMSMGKNYWSLMLSANIPFAPWSRGSLDARIKELDMHIKHGAMEIENMKIMITSEARSAIERIKSSRRQAEQIEQRILPHYEAAYQSMMISFQTGKADTAMLLSMLRMIYMTKDDLVMALAGSKMAEADFYKAIGTSNMKSEAHHD
ncbi:MAG TPA: TolC family protein, partial [bacterium]|nr:TolC family protein [bacterium]